MSKIFISSIAHDIDKCEINSNGFKKSFNYKSKNFNIIAFEKQNVCFDNYYVQGDDFGVIVGTYIFNDKTGKEAIKRLKKQYARQNDFIKENRDRITVTLPKGTKERIKATGSSVNGFITNLVLSELEKIEQE